MTQALPTLLPAIVITGASGRMGQMLINLISRSDKVQLAGCIERKDHSWIGQDVGVMMGGAPLGRAG